MWSSAWLLFALSTRYSLPAAADRNNKNDFDNCRVGLNNLLASANCVKIFTTLCWKEQTLESLKFLLECQDLKKLDDPKEVEEKILSIYDNYVNYNYAEKATKLLAHVYVNISGTVRSSIEKEVAKIKVNRERRSCGESEIPYFGDTNVYDAAETEIRETITQGTYKQFLKMDYNDFKKQLSPKESGKMALSTKGENR